eukprot:2129862-Amphidinium_carterae.1
MEIDVLAPEGDSISSRDRAPVYFAHPSDIEAITNLNGLMEPFVTHLQNDRAFWLSALIRKYLAIRLHGSAN